MKARFDIDVSGQFEWDLLPGESCDEALQSVTGAIRQTVEKALADIPWDCIFRDVKVIDVSAHEVEYDSELVVL